MNIPSNIPAPMPSPSMRVAILGLGLMGGSLALALRALPRAIWLVGYDAAAGVARRAREEGALDVAAQGAAEAVAEADVVVLATPPLALRESLRVIAPAIRPDAIVTDLAGVKRVVVAWADESLPASALFIGGHPMTGSEQSGFAAARATLYRGATWLLTPTANTDAAALARLTTLITELGAVPRMLTPERHDHLIAGVSHLPLLLATALTQTVTSDPDWSAMAPLAAGGFRDTTRVASGDPAMARDICLTNSDNLLGWLDASMETLVSLRARLAAIAATPAGGAVDRDAPDAALLQFFSAIKDARDAWSAQQMTAAPLV